MQPFESFIYKLEKSCSFIHTFGFFLGIFSEKNVRVLILVAYKNHLLETLIYVEKIFFWHLVVKCVDDKKKVGKTT